MKLKMNTAGCWVLRLGGPSAHDHGVMMEYFLRENQRRREKPVPTTLNYKFYRSNTGI
jgi:hypothetical protein